MRNLFTFGGTNTKEMTVCKKDANNAKENQAVSTVRNATGADGKTDEKVISMPSGSFMSMDPIGSGATSVFAHSTKGDGQWVFVLDTITNDPGLLINYITGWFQNHHRALF